jgi:predicted DNA-binding transcriptional regulator YafY
LLSLAISEKLSFPMFSSEVARARKKIVDAFPTSERRKIAPLRERIFVGRTASTTVRTNYRTPEPDVMRRLQVAFVREATVRADYVKESGESSSRRVEPHAMLISWPAWYLLGFDHLRHEPRMFRFDRFRNVEVEDGASFRARPREIAAVLLCEHAARMEPV